MNQIENGILKKDGKSTYVIGQSYYASFHELKVPVLEDDDRIGQMQLDIKEMEECGFNFVRFAALGDVRKNSDDSISCDYPFIDNIRYCLLYLACRLQLP